MREKGQKIACKYCQHSEGRRWRWNKNIWCNWMNDIKQPHIYCHMFFPKKEMI